MIKKGDFVNISYVGKVNDKVFDSNEVVIVVGAGHLIKGIDEALVGKEIGSSFRVKVSPEKGFGKKDPKLLKIIPEKIFKEQKIIPKPGMEVNIDNVIGRIISVSGGRVIVDFNHPLAGKTLDYDIKINKKVKDKKEKIFSLIKLYTGKEFKIEIKDSNVKIYQEGKLILPKVKKIIADDIKKYVKVKSVEFIEKFGSGEK